MRDRRFVAVHRGGPLTVSEHRLLAVWAAGCAEHVLPLFEEDGPDDRPQRAIAVARSWARGGMAVGDAQQAALGAHAAARAAVGRPAAVAAARAAGHAAATAHMADHSLGVALYAVKAAEAAGAAGAAASDERAWQIGQLPDAVRELVVSALDRRLEGS